MMRRAWIFLALALLSLFAIGCGGAASEAKSPGYGGDAVATASVDRDADGITDEVDAMPEEAQQESLYRGEAQDAPARGGMPMAQAPAGPAPPPPVAKPQPQEPTAVDAEGKPAPAGQPTVDTGTDPKVAAPLLIYEANVTLAVFEARKSIDQAEKIAKELGGYLVRRDDNSITVRVPAGKFDGALGQMLKLGDVLHRDVSVKDVTAEYFDLAVRLKNAEAVRDRLQKLLEKAANVSDAIQVERELSRVTADIESMKGRLKLLRELISFSTITLRFQARPVDQIDSKVRLPFPWLHQLGLGNLLRL